MPIPNSLSIVIPVYNEHENLPTLASRLIAAMDKIGFQNWEVILVNDGSSDGSEERIRQMEIEDSRFKGVHFAHNSGQSSAIDAGFKHAQYPLVGTLDADLQNDPFDFEILLNQMKEGIGVVCGIRVNRHDTKSKKFASKIANWFRNLMTHESITDTGCSLKIYRKEALEKIKLFDGMHRFLPTLIKMEGFKAVEVPVGHHPRFAGVSKYSTFKRGWTAFFDLLAVRWMQKRRLSYQLKSESKLERESNGDSGGITETRSH